MLCGHASTSIHAGMNSVCIAHNNDPHQCSCIQNPMEDSSYCQLTPLINTWYVTEVEQITVTFDILCFYHRV